MKILIKISGSISAYKICDLVSKLKKEKHSVKIAASESALKFVGAATWEGLSGEPVFSDDFSPHRRMDHIHLNDWADLVVLAPATAQTLDSLSQGVGSNVLTTLFLARNKKTPYLVFPAMNPRMWSSEPVVRSIERLEKSENLKIFAPAEGRMACGHVGPGRLNEVVQILNEIYKVEDSNKSLRALVTFGGTTESLDGVRSISNFSSGKTGIKICEILKSEFKVTALGSWFAYHAAEPIWGIEKLSFKSSQDLSNSLCKRISEESFDLIVHSAAVSDFLPRIAENKKISSDEKMQVQWDRAPKILEQIREASKNKNVKVVSFKLTHNQDEDEVRSKILKQLDGVSDYVVHNELGRIKDETHPFAIWERSSKSILKIGQTKTEMATEIKRIGRK